LKCTNCYSVRYCSRDCQKANWKEHKTQCKEAAKEREKNALMSEKFDVALAIIEDSARGDNGSPQHMECLLRYLDENPDMLNWVDKETDGNLLMNAICMKNSPAISLLIDAGVDVNVRSSNYDALCLAAERGLSDVIPVLLKCGADANSKTKRGHTPLMFAVSNLTDNVGNVQDLLDAGAKIDTKDESWNTALAIAAKYGRESCFSFLLSKGADFMTRDIEGDTCLLKACREGYDSIVKQLLTAGADVHCTNRRKNTCLMEAAENGRVGCVEILIAAGAHDDVNNRNKDEQTALIMATQNDHVECIESLLAADADVKIRIKDGWNALMLACHRGNARCIPALLKAGSDVNAKSKHGTTPLIAACIQGHVSCVIPLLDGGANVHAADSNSRTAMYFAKLISQNKEIEKMLLERGAKPM
jgi:uncharacterized protein